MKRKRIQFIAILLTGFFVGAVTVLSAMEVFAQVRSAVTNGFGYAAGTGFGTRDLRTIIFTIVNVIMGFLAIVAVLIIAYGGLVWMTSRGNEQQVEKAKKILTNAVIGLVLIFLSYSIAFFVFNVLMRATGVGPGAGVIACAAGDPDIPCPLIDRPLGSNCPWRRVCNGRFYSACQPDLADQRCALLAPQCQARNLIPPDLSTRVRNAVVVAQIQNGAINRASVPANFEVIRNEAGLARPAGAVCTTPDQCASDNCSGDVCVGNSVAGSFSYRNGDTVITFTPDQSCGLAPPNDWRKCFSANATYQVQLKNGLGEMTCTNGTALDCALGMCGPNTFQTNNIIDVTSPELKNLADQICENSNTIQVDVRDDSEVLLVEFFADGASVRANVGVFGRLNAWETVLLGVWDPTAVAGATINMMAEAQDADSNTKSISAPFKVRPDHCCDNLVNGNEEGLNCGGDCEACGLGPPIIDYVSPALDNGGPPNDATPTDFNDDVPHGNQGNLVTLFGRNFGTQVGTVEFYDTAANTWRVARLADAVNNNCTNPWNDTYIIAEVPLAYSNNTNGHLRVTEATKGICGNGSFCTTDGSVPCAAGVCDARNYMDTTNDVVAGERRIIDFKEDGVVLPGLCLLNPNSGAFRDLVTLEGASFGAQDANSIVKFGNIMAGYPAANWGNTTITNVEVPNLLANTTAWVTVQINPAPSDVSNALPFKVTLGAQAPIIYDFEPKQGNVGSYVTITGANFGSKQGGGNVFFNATLGDFVFPIAECAEGYWTDSRIVVKAPNTGGVDAVLRVVTNTGGTADTSTLTDTDFDYGEPVAPGLCKIDPKNGEQGVHLVRLYGERFNTLNGGGSVRFYNNKNLTQAGAAPVRGSRSNTFFIGDDNHILAIVHTLAETGPLRAVDNAGNLGNTMNFTIGLCKTNDACEAAEECCLAGDFLGQCKPQGQCAGLPTVSANTWYFTTGNLGPHVIVDCTRTSDCRAGGYSSPSPMCLRDCGLDKDRDGKVDGVPVDSLITAKFDQLMDDGSLGLDVGGDGLLDNIIIRPCTDGEECTALGVQVPVVLPITINTWDYRGVPNSATSITLTPNTAKADDTLDKNTWYKVTLKSGATGIKSAAIGQELVGDGGPGTDFTWKFYTRDSDAPGKVGCVDCEEKVNILDKQWDGTCSMGDDCEDIVGTKLSQDNVCVQLRPGAGETWVWTSSLPAVPVFELGGDAADNEYIWVQALGETVIGNPAKIQGEFRVTNTPAKTTQCRVEVQFEAPYVSQYWPNCGTACINAEVGARFSREMNTADVGVVGFANSVRNNLNVKLYACGSDMRCEDQNHMYNIGAPVAFRSGFGTCGNENTTLNNIMDNLQAGEQCDDNNTVSGDGCSNRCLLEGSNMRYNSVCGNAIVTDPAYISSTNNPWIEKGENCDDGNRNSGDNCSSICLREVAPPDGALPVGENTTEIAFQIPPTYNFGYLIPGVYYRAVIDSDVQSSEGRLLWKLNFSDPMDAGKEGFSWVFRTRDDNRLCPPGRVDVAPSKAHVDIGKELIYSAIPYTRPDSCSPVFGQRLNPLLYEWAWRSTNSVAGDLLSSTGLFNAGGNLRDSCGNGIIQLGEDCDDMNVAVGDGCSAVCLNEGTVAPSCGNRRIDTGEDCDDGNLLNNDGCSGADPDTNGNNWVAGVAGSCLNEGVTDHTDKTICGNWKVEANEECDDRNIINGDGCSGEKLVAGDRLCVLEGFEAPRSICGDGIVGFGESCETCGDPKRTILRGDTCGNSDMGLNRQVVGGDGCSMSCTLENTDLNYKAGSDLRSPASICGNGVIDLGEDCDDGAWAAGDGCSDRCLHEGSYYETRDPPNVGPYQIARGLADGITDIETVTLGIRDIGNLIVGTGIPGGPGLGAFRILDHYPNGGDNCQNQNAVAIFSTEPVIAEVVPNVVVQYDNAGAWTDYYLNAGDRATHIVQSVPNSTKILLKPYDDIWAIGKYRIDFSTNAANIHDTAGNSLDCTNGECNNWEFDIVEELCKPTRVDVQVNSGSFIISPTIAQAEPNTWASYYAEAYDDYKIPKMDPIATITDAGNVNNPVVSGNIKCDYDMNICMKSANAAGRFDIWAEEGASACDVNVNNNLQVDLLYKTSNIQKDILLIGCGITVKFTGLPEANDQWNIPITGGDPVLVAGASFDWISIEQIKDQGDPAIWHQNETTAVIPGTVMAAPYNQPHVGLYDFPDHPGNIAAPNNEYQYFLSVSPQILNHDDPPAADPPGAPYDPAGNINNWSPFTGYRKAKVIASVVTAPDVKGQADFYVGNICAEKYRTKTLGEIYPLASDVNTAFLLHFDDSWKAETKNGLIDPITNSAVIFEPGLTDGQKTLGESARWDVATAGKRLSYKLKDNFNPQKGTISFWFNQRSLPAAAAAYNYYFNVQNPTSPQEFYIKVNDTGEILFAHKDDVLGSVSFKDIPAPQLNTWHYIAVTWSTVLSEPADNKYKISTELYIDGEKGEENFLGTNAKLFTTDNPMAIGSRVDFAKPIDANIDEFEIRYDLLTSDDIQKRYIAGRRCLNSAASEAPFVTTCTPTGDTTLPIICEDINNLQCLNPLISATFNMDMDALSILHKNTNEIYDNILLYEDGLSAIPENSFIGGLSYNTLTRTAEITSLEPAVRMDDRNLVMHLSFDSAGDYTDKSNNGNNDNDGLCAAGPCPLWQRQSGKVGGGLNYTKIGDNPGDGEFIEIPHSELMNFNKNSDFAIAAWVKTGDTRVLGNVDTIIEKWDGSASSSYPFAMRKLNLSGEIIVCASYNGIAGAGRANPQARSSKVFNDDKWHLVACNFNFSENNITIWVDGVLDVTAFFGNFTGDINNNQELCIGARCTPSDYFHGDIDEVKIWSRNLGASEMKQLYLDGSLILKMDFDERANPTKDVSGQGRNGVCAGENCPAWTENGRYGGAMVFDGKDDYINAGQVLDGADNTKPFTMSAWVKNDERNQGWKTIIGTNSSWAQIAIADRTVRFGQNGPCGWLENGGAINNEWHNVVGVFDGDLASIYVDGVLEWGPLHPTNEDAVNTPLGLCSEPENDPLNPIFDNSHRETLIGRYNSITEMTELFQGTIDEVAIWDKALTEDEVVKQYYNSLLTPGKIYAVRVKGGMSGVKSKVGVGMNDTDDAADSPDRVWKLGIAANAQLCNCDKVKVTITTGRGANEKKQETLRDLFTCAGNSCTDDTNNTVNGNQHLYSAQCQDVSSGAPIDIDGTYLWVQNDPKKLFTWPASPITTPSIVVTNTSVNGDASVTVEGRGDPAQGAGGKDEKTISLTNFVCNNPWPSFDNLYFDDVSGSPDSGGVTPYTNFRFFYCRDQKNTPSAIDDLPSLDTRIAPVAP